MSLQIPERLTSEYLPLIRESISKGIGYVAVHNSASASSLESSHNAISDVAAHMPKGGLAYSSFGELTQLYDQNADTQEIDIIVDEIAQHVAVDFAQWEDELRGKVKTASPNPLVHINRNDADNAIALWQAHPSEDTEAAARHILHYALHAIPASVRQAWSESYLDAYERMVAAHRDFESSGGANDKLTLNTALRQTAIARHSLKDQETFSFTIDQYDSNFRNED